MPEVFLQKVSKKYKDVVALASLDLKVCEGEFLTLLGPSGCGKTTALRLMAGFIQPTSGRILLDGNDVTKLPPNRRGIGMVFQSYALFPHLTIEANIGFGLRESGAPSARIRSEVKDLLELVKLPHAGPSYPSELSGGQQQRIALARAVAGKPRVLLMDEPLGALDLSLRVAMQVEIRRIQKQLGITTVYVTHDQTEAMRMSDRIAVMNQGHLEQIGSPKEIYNAPRNSFVGTFLGRLNLIPARVIEHRHDHTVIEACGKQCLVARVERFASGDRLTLGLRAEDLKLKPPGMGMSSNVFGAVVESQVFVGNVCELRLRLANGETISMDASPEEMDCAGEGVNIFWGAADAKLFDE